MGYGPLAQAGQMPGQNGGGAKGGGGGAIGGGPPPGFGQRPQAQASPFSDPNFNTPQGQQAIQGLFNAEHSAPPPGFGQAGGVGTPGTIDPMTAANQQLQTAYRSNLPGGTPMPMQQTPTQGGGGAKGGTGQTNNPAPAAMQPNMLQQSTPTSTPTTGTPAKGSAA